MRRAVSAFAAVVLAAGVGACASSGSGDTGDTGSAGPRTEITTEQLRELPNMSAYDAVRRLKPTWLRKRGPDSLRTGSSLVVIERYVVRGGVRLLSDYQIRDLMAIRYLDPQQATLKYGTEASGGAIVIVPFG